MILFVGDRKGLDLFPSELADESVDVIDDCISIDDIVSKTRSDKRYVIAVFDINFFEGYTDDKLLKAFYLFSHTSSAHLIILAQGRKSGDRFLSDLIEMNLYDFVNALNFRLAAQQFVDCVNRRDINDVSSYAALKPITKEKKSLFSVKGKKEVRTSVGQAETSQPDPILKKNEKLKLQKEKNSISIGVAGVCSRIGTTTQALRLTKHLTDKGREACYVEANSMGHVNIIGSVFSEVKQTGSSYLYLGLTMYASRHLCPREDFAVIVYDCGIDSESEVFKACDIKIIIAGSAAWEMAALAQKLNGFDDDCNFIFSFTSPTEHDDILSFMAQRWKNTFFAEFSPDMFDWLSEKEESMYEKLVKGLK